MVSQAIQQKILAVSRQAPSLRKTERNSDAGFSFVSIDDFYEQVASLATDIGLGWTIVEEGIDIVNVDGQSAIFQKFRVDVYETQTGSFAEGYFRLTIPAPFSGAQTAGISVSYLDKCFMRSAFKIVTGEKDADHMAKKRDKAPQKPAETDKVEAKPKADPKVKAAGKPAKAEGPASDEAGYKAIADRLIEILNDIGDEAGLDQFRTDEQGEINKLKAAAETSEAAAAEKDRVQARYSELYDKLVGE